MKICRFNDNRIGEVVDDSAFDIGYLILAVEDPYAEFEHSI